jgi:hypothetical protein
VSEIFILKHKYESKELLLTLATILPEDWIIRAKGMYLKGVPSRADTKNLY